MRRELRIQYPGAIYHFLTNLQAASCLLMLVLAGAARAGSPGTAFVYQGLLQQSGTNAINNPCDFQFSLWDASTGGTLIGATQTLAAVSVSNGLFTATLDFGSGAFDGNARWLLIGVRAPAGSGSYSVLNPRQAVRPTPYALNAAAVAAGAVNSNGLAPGSVTSGALAANAVVAGKLAPGAVSLATNVSGILPVSNGGSGAGTPAAALANLGAASLAGANNFGGVNTLSNPANVLAGSFIGNGAGLSNLNLANTTGKLADGQLSPNVALLNANQRFTGSNVFLGNVGIFVTNPASALQVAGTVTATAFVGSGSGLTNLDRGIPWEPVIGTNQIALADHGYLPTNNSLVTITLPVAPALGDVVRVAGVGVGGWRIGQNAGQFILASSFGGLAGRIWVAHGPGNNWTCLASSSDGSRLVAGTGGNQLYTSADSGATWTAKGNSLTWTGVASSADGVRLVAVASQGQNIYVSTNGGATWSPRASPRNWSGVGSSSDGARLVAVVNGGQIYVSGDFGQNWTARETNRAWQATASSADGAHLVAAVNGGQIYTSADFGATWAAADSNRVWRALASSADGARLVAAVNGGQIYTSTDFGANWTAHDANRAWQSVASSADGTRLIAVVNGGAGQVFTSADAGLTWIARTNIANVQCVASSADASKLAVGVNPGSIYTSVSTTTLGTAGYLQGDADAAVEILYIGNNQFRILSHEGTIAAL